MANTHDLMGQFMIKKGIEKFLTKRAPMNTKLFVTIKELY